MAAVVAVSLPGRTLQLRPGVRGRASLSLSLAWLVDVDGGGPAVLPGLGALRLLGFVSPPPPPQRSRSGGSSQTLELH